MPTEGINKLIIDSKLHLPRPRFKTLRRARLLNRLTDSRSRKLILVCAPAGYGKTTLLSQFLARTRLPYVYYLLEKTDSEPAVFLSYLLAGLRSIRPGFGRKTERLTHLFNYPQRFFEVIAGTLVNEINDEFKTGLLLILDDYQALESAPMIDRLVDHLLRHVEPAVHLIITSRFVPGISLGLWKGRGEVMELTAENLRFDRREIRDFLAKAIPDRFPEDELEWIESYSEGWPVALRFLQEALRHGEDIAAGREKWRSLARTDLFQYFAQEIYDREPPALQEFLKRCAIPDWLTSDLCNRITGRTDAREILPELVQRNMFLFPYGRSGYRFHNLFRDFLNRKIIDTPEECQVSRQTAEFYRVRKESEAALKFYYRAGDYETAAGIVEDIGAELIRQGKSGVLDGYLQQLPEHLVRDRYRLLLHQSQVYLFQGRGEEAKAACAAAIKSLRTKPKLRAEYADALYKLAGLAMNEGNYKTAARLFRTALSSGSRKYPHIYAAILNSYGSLLCATSGRDRSRVAGYFRTAQRLARKIKNPELEASILNNWARSEWEAGKIETAYPKFIRMAGILKDHFTPGCGGGFFNAARLSLLMGDRNEARKILEQGLKVCSAYDDQWSRARIFQGFAQLYRELSDHRKAQDHIEQALGIYRQIGVPGLTSAAHAEAARIALAQGRTTEAEKDLAAAWSLKKSAADADTIALQIVEAEIRIRQGRYGDAEKMLGDAQGNARKYHKVIESMDIVRRMAEVRFRKGETEAAAKALAAALKLARTCGPGNFLIRTWEKEEWLTEFLKQQAFRSGKSRIYEPLRLPILAARFFGTPRVAWNDRPIEDRCWPTAKAKKMLFFLICRYPEKSGADQLLETLWPGSGRSAGQNSLRKALQHIRQALASGGADPDIITAEKGSFGFAPNVVIRRDIDQLKIQAAKHPEDIKRSRNWRFNLERVLAQTAPGIANGWFDDWLEDLRATYIKWRETGLRQLADYYWKSKKYPEASGCYKKLIGIDPYEESYYRAMMVIAAKKRNCREVKRIYSRLAAWLKSEMSASPQAATTNLYQELVSQPA